MPRITCHQVICCTLTACVLVALATAAFSGAAVPPQEGQTPQTPPKPPAPPTHTPLKKEDTKSEAAKPKPTYVGSDKCASCHKNIATKHQSGRHAALLQASLPPDMRGCEACHGPASLHLGGDEKAMLNPAKMKPAEADASCLKCHAADSSSAAPQVGQKFALRLYLRGKHARKGVACVACHSEHHGAEHLLKKDANELCADCHADMKAKEGVYLHRPVKGGECLQCHEPHASRRPSLTKPTVDATCAECHDTEEDKFSKAHNDYDMKGTRCTTCHTAHIKEKGSKGLMAHQHAPFSEHKCTLCHQSAVTSKKATLIKPVNELCVRCHAETVSEDTNGKGAHMHPPVQERFCLGCHAPHSSRQSRAPLFKASTEQTCTTCHAEIDNQCTQPVKHLPVEAGNCLACHVGHKSPQEKLLTKPSIDLCQSCHPDEHKITHPVGVRDNGKEKKAVTDPRSGKMMTCATCHEVHGGTHKFLTTHDWQRELCVQCHKVDK